MTINALTIFHRLTSRAKLRHMQALIALNDLGSMGLAARSVGMTQPAMSQLVADLEQLVEVQLFLRHSKGVTPTATGMDLIPIARRIIAAMEEGAERIASRQLRDSSLVRVASTAAASGALLDLVFPSFARSHPNIQVQVSTVLGSSLDAAFIEDEYDVICCRPREAVPDGWVFTSCIEDELVVVCGTSHTLARQKLVKLTDLGRFTWVQNHISTIARREFDALAARARWKDIREVQIMSRATLPILTMLKSGEHLALVPRSVVAPWLTSGDLVEVPAQLGLKLSPIGYYWKAHASSPASNVLTRAMLSITEKPTN